jgi:cell pole-organizing protein PopZ
MPEPQPPRITPDTPIGPDVDLDREDIRLADGTRLTQEVADRIVTQARRGGRPSLSGEAAASPQIAFRVSPAVRDKAAAVASAEHKTISDLAREALERYLAERPGV